MIQLRADTKGLATGLAQAAAAVQRVRLARCRVCDRVHPYRKTRSRRLATLPVCACGARALRLETVANSRPRPARTVARRPRRPLAAASRALLFALAAIGTLAAVLLVLPGCAGGNPPELLVFSADWCQPCQQMEPLVDRLESRRLVTVRRVNVDRDAGLAARWDVQAVPCFVLVAGGAEVARLVGATSYTQLEELCRRGILRARPEAGPSPPRPPNGPPPAIVRVIGHEPDGPALGTGAIIALDAQRALVATAAHNLRHARSIVVVVAGRALPARLLAKDDLWDWAFLAAAGEMPPTLKPLMIADADPTLGDTLGVGGLGDPSGLYWGSCGRLAQWVAPARDQPFALAQINARVRQGDSGGPVWNTRGQWLGIISASAAGEPWTVAVTFPYLRQPVARVLTLWRAEREASLDAAGEADVPTDPAVERRSTPDEPVEPPLPLPHPLPPQPAASPPAPDAAPGDPGGVVDVPGAVPAPSTPYAPDATAGGPGGPDATPGAGALRPGALAGGVEGGLQLDGLARAAGDAALARVLPWALAALGLGTLTPAGFAAIYALRLLIRWRRWRRLPGQTQPTEGTAPAVAGDNFCRVARDTTEARQLLQLSQLEGRDPLSDALVGRLCYDELDRAIEADPSGPEAEYARKIRRTLEDRLHAIAPLAVYPDDFTNTTPV